MPDKPLFWIGSSLKDLCALPDAVQQVFGYALRLAQQGKKHGAAKPLKGFHGAGVLEVIEDHDGDTYRAVYTVQFEGRVVRASRLSEEIEARDRDAEGR